MRTSPPIRFIALAVVMWVGGRIWLLMPETDEEPAFFAARPVGTGPTLKTTIIAAPIAQQSSHPANLRSIGIPKRAALIEPPKQAFSAAKFAPGRYPSSQAAGRTPAAPPIINLPIPALSVAPRDDSRWSGSAYLFARNGVGETLAADGQLGGGQVAARIAWRLNPVGPTRLAIAARISAPLDDHRGAEAAAGLDIHPLPGQPLRISVERRIDIGGNGRNAWSAYAAGGFWRTLGGGVEADGYAQAGIVGTKARDLFADGALRIAHRQEIAPNLGLRLGGGIWGGAQPGVERLDIGPRAALSLPIRDRLITTAIEGRLRIAGDAAPGSGIALTLATDF